MRGLSRGDQHLLVQLLSSSAADFVERWFESDALKATLSASGIIGTFLGVRSPGTAYVLLHHYMGEIDGAFRAWGVPRGGTGAVSKAMAGAASAAGAMLTTDAPVARVLVNEGARRASCWRMATSIARRWWSRAPTCGSRSSGWSA